MSNTLTPEQQQTELAKRFSNILVSIMKLEDRFNQMETKYIQMKTRSSQGKNKSNENQATRDDYVEFESRFYELFREKFSQKSQEISNAIDKMADQMKIIAESDSKQRNQNIRILPKILSIKNGKNFNEIIKSNNSSWDPERKISKIFNTYPRYQPIFLKFFSELKGDGSNINDIADKIKKRYLLKESKSFENIFRLPRNRINIELINSFLKEFFIDNDSKKTPLDILNLIYSLQGVIDSRGSNSFDRVRQNIDFTKLNKILDNLQNQFIDYPDIRTSSVKLDLNQIDVSEYKKNFEEILQIFLRYKQYNNVNLMRNNSKISITRKEIGNFGNLINNINHPIKKHFNGMTIVFVFVTRLLKYYIVTLISKRAKETNIPIISMDNLNESIGEKKIILMRPSITKGDIYKLLSTPQTYQECRNKWITSDAKTLSQIGREILEDLEGKIGENIFCFKSGLSTAQFIKADPSPELNVLNQKENAIKKITDKFYQIESDQPIYFICEPWEMKKIFNIDNQLPYGSQLEITIDITNKNKLTIKPIKDKKILIDGVEKTLSPTSKDYVEDVKQWYKGLDPLIDLSCDNNEI
jgi:hypothetical protein